MTRRIAGELGERHRHALRKTGDAPPADGGLRAGAGCDVPKDQRGLVVEGDGSSLRVDDREVRVPTEREAGLGQHKLPCEGQDPGKLERTKVHTRAASELFGDDAAPRCLLEHDDLEPRACEDARADVAAPDHDRARHE